MEVAMIPNLKDNLRVAVASEGGEGLEARVSGHFGRCSHYTFVKLAKGVVEEVSAKENPHALSHRPGVLPGWLSEQGVDLVVSGGMGRRAIALFEERGVQVRTGARGAVGEAIAQLNQEASPPEPCADGGGNCGGHH